MNQKTVLIAGFIGLLFGVLFAGTLGLDFFGTNDFEDPNGNLVIDDELTEEELAMEAFKQKYNIDESIYIEVSGTEAYLKMDNEDTFVLYIGRHTCPFCQQYVPVLMEAAQNKGLTELYHVSTIDPENSNFVDMENINITPTTYFVVEGVVVETVLGYIPLDDIEDLLETHIVQN